MVKNILKAVTSLKYCVIMYLPWQHNIHKEYQLESRQVTSITQCHSFSFSSNSFSVNSIFPNLFLKCHDYDNSWPLSQGSRASLTCANEDDVMLYHHNILEDWNNDKDVKKTIYFHELILYHINITVAQIC